MTMQKPKSSSLCRKHSLILICTLLLFFSSINSISARILQTATYGGHTYYLLDRSYGWQAAEDEAISLSGHLVTINDAAENEWVLNTFGQTVLDAIGPLSGYQTPSILLGLYRDRGSSEWKWADGVTASFLNWTGTEPGMGWDEIMTGMMLVKPSWMENWVAGGWHDIYDPPAPWDLVYGVVEVSSPGEVNRPPVLDPIGNKSVAEGQLLIFTVTASDPDGDGLTFSASNLPTGADFDNATQTFSWVPNENQAGSYPNVLFTVTDDGSPPMSASEFITLTATPLQPPVTILKSATYGGHTYYLLDRSYSWQAAEDEAMSLNGHLVTINDDAENEWVLNTFGQTVLDAIGPLSGYQTPSILLGLHRDRGSPEWKWADGATASFLNWTGTEPGMGWDEITTGMMLVKPSWMENWVAGGWHDIYDPPAPWDLVYGVVEVSSPGEVNRPPVLDPIGNKSVAEGQLLIFTVTASDPDGDGLTFSANNLPTGADFDNATQTFSWTPSFDQAGEYSNIRFSVTDNGGRTASEAIIITVGDVNRPPVLNPIGGKTVLEGQNLQFTLTGSDPDGDSLTFCAEGLPTGASFFGQTFSWTPAYDQAENYQVEFSVLDTGNPLGIAVELVTITVGNVDRPPVIDPIGSKQGVEGQTLQFYIYATDADGDTLTYSASDLPPGGTFNPESRLFSWTPAYGLAGNYTVTFGAFDGIIKSESVVVITVNQPSPSEISAAIVNIVLNLHLDKSVENSYIANIKKLDDFIARGNKTPAINQANAFLHKVEDDISKGKISAEDGELLILMGTELKTMLII